MKPIPALVPFSWLYGCGVVLRNICFDRKIFRIDRISVPVISVGNISAGGTGKTPVVESIARMLTERNVRTAIISRGYRRRTHGTVEVSDGTTVKATASESGDEPFQLATRLPHAAVVVDAQRGRGARYAATGLSAKAIVLDDGFQHRAIHRDLDIVVIDASYPPFTMLMLPAGYRRETLTSLKRADVVLLTKVKPSTNVEEIKEQIRKYSNAKVFTSTFTVSAFRRAKTRFSVNLNSVKGKKVVAFCGIGQPESFRRSLEEIGVTVGSVIPFGDHHEYSINDLRRISEEQLRLSAEYVVTTEKDIARLTATALENFLEKIPLFYLEMKTEIEQRTEWETMILAAIGGENREDLFGRNTEAPKA